MSKFLFAAIGALSTTFAAHADLVVSFIEGAPKDRFVFEMVGACATGPASLEIDLAGSNAGLIFDVTEAGAGVEVFQPFELVAGADRVTGTSPVLDGSQDLSLDVSGLEPGAQVAFTIDVDDTIGAREITVSGAEIAGAEARLVVDGQAYEAAFGPDARARITFASCLS